jgi:inosine-uridine nucleoside N-ribohydrolase
MRAQQKNSPSWDGCTIAAAVKKIHTRAQRKEVCISFSVARGERKCFRDDAAAALENSTYWKRGTRELFVLCAGMLQRNSNKSRRAHSFLAGEIIAG